jgi:hypothetical protein
MFVSVLIFRQLQIRSKLSNKYVDHTCHEAYILIKLVIKKLTVQIKRILLMQGKVEPNCLHLLVAVKQINLFDLDKFLTFIIEKRYKKPIIF